MASNGRIILLTGVTGFIGSYLLRDLIREGDTVICLARGEKAQTAQERIADTLAGHKYQEGANFSREQIRTLLSPDGLHGARVRVVEADLATLGQETKEGKEDDRLRLEQETRRVLNELGTDTIDAVVLSAAALGMKEEDRERAELVNVYATQGLLRMMRRLQAGSAREEAVTIGELDTLGTGYMFGTRAPEGRVLSHEEIDAWDEAGYFPNPYTLTKHRQARVVTDQCAKAGIRHNLHLFSIVGGDPRRSNFGFNAFMKFAGKRRLLGSLLEGCLKFGIKIPFPGDAEARVDIVDVEDVTGRVVKVIHHDTAAESQEGKLYYHTNPNPEVLKDLMVKVLTHYGYEDVPRIVNEAINFVPARTIKDILGVLRADVEGKLGPLGAAAGKFLSSTEGFMNSALGKLEPLFFVLSGKTFPPAGKENSFRSYLDIKQRIDEVRPWLGDDFRSIDAEYLADRYPVEGRMMRQERASGLPIEAR